MSKYVTFCCVCFWACTVLNGFFPCLAQMITSVRGCVACNDILILTNIFKVIQLWLCNESAKYVISCHVRSAPCTVKDEFFPYWAQMFTSKRGGVARNALWSWPISLRLFSCDIAYFMDYIYVWRKYNPWRDYVSHTISSSKVKVTLGGLNFCSRSRGYPSSSLIYNF